MDPSPADQARLQAIENETALEDAATLDRYGVPGRDIFRATQGFIANIRRGAPACPAS